MCVGRRFADLEIETIVAKVTYLSWPLSIRTKGGRSEYKRIPSLFQVFRNFELRWNRPPVKTDFTVLLTFKSPLTFTVKDR